MKKVGKILAGALLGAAFMGSVGFYCWQYDVGGIKDVFAEEEDEEESETLIQVKMKMPEKKTYQLGEEAECEGLAWKFDEAEIIEDYDSLDAYYKSRSNLLLPSDAIHMRGGQMFVDDIHFLRLKGTVRNTSETLNKNYHLSKMELCNLMPDETFTSVIYSPIGSDGRCTAQSGTEKSLMDAGDAFLIEPQETVEFEYIVEFSESESPSHVHYDLHVSVSSLIPDSVYLYNGADNKICLNIAPKHLSYKDTDIENCYEEQRDIPKMKSNQWTNLDMKQYQRKGYPVAYEKDGVFREGEDIVEENYVFEDWTGIKTQITGVNTIDWAELPQEFADRGALNDMAARYEQEFGYDRSQLKILLLDININRFEEIGSPDTEIYEFYENTNLFTRDENGQRWIFGTADDWLITENSAEGGRVGHINIERLALGQTITYQAAYLLPPEIYNEGELYFCGGGMKESSYEQMPAQKISIR